MEGLCKELSCPACLDLFTPPIIELSCGHNYCEKCIIHTITAHCAHTTTNLEFLCPTCRKALTVGKKGFSGLKRNMFAENVLVQVKDMAKDEEKNIPKTQMCPEHDEEMSLMCVEDNSLICSSCKLFGDHSAHTVSTISDVYEERKNSFIELMKSLEDKLKGNAKHIVSLRQQKGDLLSTTKNIEVFLKKLGESIIEEIQMKVADINLKVHTECSMRCRSLEDGKKELSAPQLIYAEMKKHLEVNKCPIEFLKHERKLYEEAVKMLDPKDLSAQYREYISLGQYVEELMKGIDVKEMGTVKRSSFLKKISQNLKAWKSGHADFNFSAYRSLDVMLTKTSSLEWDSKSDEDYSFSWEIQSSSEEEDV